MGFRILVCAFFCPGPRAAHTFHSTGVVGYWPSLIFMSCCPCCTLFAANSITELNVTLGGEKRNCCMSCLCSFFCSCCVIAQDAATLDMITGMETGLIGVYKV